MRDPRHGQPSPRAVEDLAADVGSEVDDLRSRLRGALSRAEELEAAGLVDQAAAVLEAERAALTQLHQRLEARLADAAVEREAEQVVAAAAPATAAPAATDEATADGEVTAEVTALAPRRSLDGVGHTSARGPGIGLRLLVSAAAGVVGIALLLVPDAGGGSLTIAGWGWAGGADLPDAVEARENAAEGVVPGTADTTTPDPVTGLAALRALELAEDGTPLAAMRGRAAGGTGTDDDAPALGTVEGVLEELEALVEPSAPTWPADGPTEDDAVPDEDDADDGSDESDAGDGGGTRDDRAGDDDAPIDPTTPFVEERGLGD